MRIEKLELNNFRGFEHLEIEFPKEEAGLAVLIGVNGSGKSSVLEAVVSFFEHGMNRMMNEKTTPIYTPLDLHLDSFQLDNYLDFSYFKNKGERANNSYYLTNPELNKFGNGATAFYERLITKIEANKNLNVPLIAYYNAQRKVESQYFEPSIKRYLVPQFKAYEHALSAGLNFRDFEKWFIDRENNENREKIKRKTFNYIDKELQSVREAVNTFFTNWGVQNLQGNELEFNTKTNISSSLGIEKNGQSLNLSQLSDGERMVVLLVADIARRLTIANPITEEKSSIETGEGLVLVDEIDLYLHPAWQRKIIPNLRKTFPNIQFIVTTHSPQVLSSVPRENVIVLDDFKVYKSAHTKGRDSNSILADVFGVRSRPEFAEKEFRKLYQLIDDPTKEKEAYEMLKNMKEKYGAEDTEIVRAELHLEFLAGESA